MQTNPAFTTNTRKSLFSLQVDDVIIQRIFKSLEEEIRKLNKEIFQLKEDVNARTTNEQFKEFEEYVKTFNQNAQNSINSLEENHKKMNIEFNNKIDDVKKYADQQIATATFSVNSSIRAQNALIEEKVFQLSRPTVEFEKLQRDVMKIKEKNKEIISNTGQIQNFFKSFLNDNGGGKINTLDGFIDRALRTVRDQIDNLESFQLKTDQRLSRADYYFKKLFGKEDVVLPPYGKAEKIILHEKPRLPVLTDPISVMDYINYLMIFAPAVQKAISSFYHQYISLSNSVYDREEKEISLESLQDKLSQLGKIENDIMEMKNQAFNHERYESIIQMIEDLKSMQENRSEIESLQQQLDEIRNEYAPKKEIEKALVDMKQNVGTMLTDAITDMKSSDMFYQDAQLQPDYQLSKPVVNDSAPAVAAVTPRGNISHKMIYKQPPSSTRVFVPRKEEIEEPGKQYRRQKTPSRINVPLDTIPQHQIPSKSALASNRRFD